MATDADDLEVQKLYDTSAILDDNIANLSAEPEKVKKKKSVQKKIALDIIQ